MSPDTPRMESGNPLKDHANTQDKLLVRQAAVAGRAVVELKRMQAEQAKANDQLMRIGKNVDPSIRTNSIRSTVACAT
jgi:hypothetical protein